jgi:hypothetical protein
MDPIHGQHAMTPTGVAVTIMLAVLIDMMSVGPNSIRDRVAWVFAVTAIRDGFSGSDIERNTVGKVADALAAGLKQTGDAYIHAADANKIVGAVIGCIWIFTICALVPDSWASRMGPAARMRFGRRHSLTVDDGGASSGPRLNYWLWGSAFLVGISGHLAQGAIGASIDIVLNTIVWPVVWLMTFLFG